MNPDHPDESSRKKLFEYLAASEGFIVSGSSLTEKLHSSRQAVFKLIRALREEGLNIDSVPQKGYILRDINKTDAISPTLIEFLIKGNPVFNKCLYIPKVSSTQQVIKKLAAQDAPEGIVAVTDEQTGGRGRMGRVWQAPAGKNLLFSVLLRPKLRPGDVQLLNLAAGMAVCNVLRTNYNIPAELKWPNDTLVNGRKICGILSEAAGEPDKIYYAATGIGINANISYSDIEEDIKDKATSIMIETGEKCSRPKLLEHVLREFAFFVDELGSSEGKNKLLSEYKTVCSTLGKEVRVIQDDREFLGFAHGITEQGALIVKINGEDKIFAAADVHHLRLK
jgi:BirA family biotin operon repressor/biotin-[acetyl-CoA-carboxylase] ligase